MKYCQAVKKYGRTIWGLLEDRNLLYLLMKFVVTACPVVSTFVKLPLVKEHTICHRLPPRLI